LVDRKSEEETTFNVKGAMKWQRIHHEERQSGSVLLDVQANNNEVIARSSESYVNRGDCLHSIYLVRTLSPTVVVWEGAADGTFSNVTSDLK
jgi:uncharacterized protein YegP (UPF0339 family)